MAGSDELVELCTCIDGMQAQAVRASLEARGIRVFVKDQQTNDVLGFVHGGFVPPRVMVPAGDLATAKVIAEDVMGPLDGLPDPEDPEERVDDPMRPIPREEWEEETDEEEDEEERLPPKRKSVGIPLLLAFLGLSLGLSHIYAGRGAIGMALVTVAVFGIALIIGGNEVGTFVVGTVWVLDTVGGILGVLAHNRAIDRAAASR